VLVHDEDPGLADLRQLTLHGTVRDGIFRAQRRTGSLDPAHPGTLDHLRSLRALGRAARKNRPVPARWGLEGSPSSRPCCVGYGSEGRPGSYSV
jgi:hypothetical protein